MCDVLFCFSGDPVENDPRAQFANKWKITMLEAPSAHMAWFFYGCCCTPCASYQMRTMALAADWPANYTCCQNYFQCGPCGGGKCGEKSCPELCLCVEVCFCTACAISATRFYIMDKYNILPDPMDNKILRFNNCVQILSCIISIIAIFVPDLREAADYIQLIAKIVFHITAGCMMSQMHYELTQDGAPGSGGSKPKGAPVMEAVMDR